MNRERTRVETELCLLVEREWSRAVLRCMGKFGCKIPNAKFYESNECIFLLLLVRNTFLTCSFSATEESIFACRFPSLSGLVKFLNSWMPNGSTNEKKIETAFSVLVLRPLYCNDRTNPLLTPCGCCRCDKHRRPFY